MVVDCDSEWLARDCFVDAYVGLSVEANSKEKQNLREKGPVSFC